MHSVYETKKDDFWRDEIAMNGHNAKRLWRTMEGLLNEAFTDDTSLHAADDFAVFFKDKSAVRASTATTPAYEVPFKATTSTLEE